MAVNSEMFVEVNIQNYNYVIHEPILGSWPEITYADANMINQFAYQ